MNIHSGRVLLNAKEVHSLENKKAEKTEERVKVDQAHLYHHLNLLIYVKVDQLHLYHQHNSTLPGVRSRRLVQHTARIYQVENCHKAYSLALTLFSFAQGT